MIDGEEEGLCGVWLCWHEITGINRADPYTPD